MLGNDWVALIVTFALALAWLRLNDFSARRGWVSSAISRKIIHIGTGPLFVLCWLLFTSSTLARFLAALVPLAITAQFGLVGSGIIKDQDAVDAMSRSGDRREILRGPLYYGIVFIALTLIFWRTSPIGIVALMILCGGDGLADLAGQHFAGPHLPWSPGKTWSGSLAVFAGGWIFATAVLAAFAARGLLPGRWAAYLPGLALVALAGMLVESLPFRDIDNLTVPLASVALGFLVF
jgi:phytol kinase